jgi:predicted  nucleic acid-binding Zn-ribbon protein
MMWEYCANCGSISLKSVDGLMKQCNKCGWRGVPDKADMAQINKKARASVGNPRMVAAAERRAKEPVDPHAPKESTKDLKERLKKQSDDFDIF